MSKTLDARTMPSLTIVALKTLFTFFYPSTSRASDNNYHEFSKVETLFTIARLDQVPQLEQTAQIRARFCTCPHHLVTTHPTGFPGSALLLMAAVFHPMVMYCHVSGVNQLKAGTNIINYALFHVNYTTLN
jgi:hypothetical protein